MAKVVLHELPGAKRAGEVAVVVEQLYGQGERLLVWVADAGRLQVFDDYLWTFRKLSFVPHGVWSPEIGEIMVEPVVLLAEPGNPNQATVLVVGDELPPADWARTFAEVHDFVPPGDQGAERRQHWADLGFEL